MPSSGFQGGKYTITFPFVLRKLLGVKATVMVTPESPTRYEDGVSDPAVITSGYKLERVALMKVALVVPAEFARLVAMLEIGVSELGFLKVNTRKVHLFREVIVESPMVTMLATILQDVIDIPVVADTQCERVVLATKDPGFGTLNTIVSPVLKNPVDDVKETTKLSVAGAPTV